MRYQNLIVETGDRVARITLNRPPLNIMDLQTIQELDQALSAVESDPELQIILLRGAGDRGFSAGVDIEEHRPERVGEMIRSFHRVFRRLLTWEKISVCAVHGFAYGGGCELVAACDLALAEEEARLGQPEINVGCFPPIAALLLPNEAGMKAACELLLTGLAVTAKEAAIMGLINRVVPPEELEVEAERLVGELKKKSPIVLQLTKRALLTGRAGPELKSLERIERIYLEDLMQTGDAVEGVGAFLEKRKPIWKGT